MSRSEICVVQGRHRCASALYSCLELTQLLRARYPRVALLLPEEDHTQLEHSSYSCASELHELVGKPQVIVLCSHDAAFKSLRRDARTLRWMHETTRTYDPQAARCATPLFATAVPDPPLPGFAGLAGPFCQLAPDIVPRFVPGPLHIISAGAISDSRSNFKAFQTLAERFPSVTCTWVGATCSKRWNNMQLLTADASLLDALAVADVYMHCADNDVWPVDGFLALACGLRVCLFKRFGEDATLLRSSTGMPLLTVSAGVPQNAPLQEFCKNPKLAPDVELARAFVRQELHSPPQLLLDAIAARM